MEGLGELHAGSDAPIIDNSGGASNDDRTHSRALILAPTGSPLTRHDGRRARATLRHMRTVLRTQQRVRALAVLGRFCRAVLALKADSRKAADTRPPPVDTRAPMVAGGAHSGASRGSTGVSLARSAPSPASLKLRQLMTRHHAERYHLDIKRESATSIGTFVRRYRQRQCIKTALAETRRRKHAAATTVQCAWRVRKARDTREYRRIQHVAEVTGRAAARARRAQVVALGAMVGLHRRHRLAAHPSVRSMQAAHTRSVRATKAAEARTKVEEDRTGRVTRRMHELLRRQASKLEQAEGRAVARIQAMVRGARTRSNLVRIVRKFHIAAEASRRRLGSTTGPSGPSGGGVESARGATPSVEDGDTAGGASTVHTVSTDGVARWVAGEAVGPASPGTPQTVRFAVDGSFSGNSTAGGDTPRTDATHTASQSVSTPDEHGTRTPTSGLGRLEALADSDPHDGIPEADKVAPVAQASPRGSHATPATVELSRRLFQKRRRLGAHTPGGSTSVRAAAPRPLHAPAHPRGHTPRSTRKGMAPVTPATDRAGRVLTPSTVPRKLVGRTHLGAVAHKDRTSLRQYVHELDPAPPPWRPHPASTRGERRADADANADGSESESPPNARGGGELAPPGAEEVARRRRRSRALVTSAGGHSMGDLAGGRGGSPPLGVGLDAPSVPNLPSLPSLASTEDDTAVWLSLWAQGTVVRTAGHFDVCTDPDGRAFEFNRITCRGAWGTSQADALDKEPSEAVPLGRSTMLQHIEH